MKSFVYLITDEVGIHARPAGELVKLQNSLNQKLPFQQMEKKPRLQSSWHLWDLALDRGCRFRLT